MDKGHSMSNELLKTYKAIVWIDELAGKRVEVIARDFEEASTMLKEQFGTKAVVSLWNEEDANAAR